MDLQAISNLSSRELEQFQTVCNRLLSCTYIARTRTIPDRGRFQDPDYTFLTIHHQLVADYLGLMGWRLHQEEVYGYFYVEHPDELNRCVLTREETALLLALRLYYEDHREQAGLEQDVLCTMRELLDLVVTEYAILPVRPSARMVRRAMNLLEHHAVVQRVEGVFTQNDCKFTILPTILTVVSPERVEAAVEQLQNRGEEENDEEAEADSADELAVLRETAD